MAFPESLSINISELKSSYIEFDYKFLKHVPGYKNGGYNREITANVEREIKENIIRHKINKSDPGIQDHIDLEFKLADNCFLREKARAPTPMGFYFTGVSAPFGRFNYKYKI